MQLALTPEPSSGPEPWQTEQRVTRHQLTLIFEAPYRHQASEEQAQALEDAIDEIAAEIEAMIEGSEEIQAIAESFGLEYQGMAPGG